MIKKRDDLEKKIEQYEKEGIKRVKFGLTTIDGVLVGKYINLEKFSKVAATTGPFCDVVFGWDLCDQLYDDKTLFTGWHTGFPDAKYRFDISTERRLPDENNIPFYLGNLVRNDGNTPHSISPRGVFGNILQRAYNLGFSVKMGFEYEFFVFKETPESVREKDYQNLTPLTPGSFGYSILRNSVLSDLFNEFLEYMESIDCELESVHCETGSGAWEAAIKYDEGLIASDKATIFKTFSKAFFEKRNLMATFMAKYAMAEMGLGCHIHHSLYDSKTHKSLFHDPKQYANMSRKMKQFVAGQMKYMREFLVLSAPTINSYTRLVKGAWAPTSATWGVDNRTTAIRVISGTKESQHIEYRVPGADCNPYLAATALLASGLIGIEEELELPEETKGNVYEIQKGFAKERIFPTNLKDSYRAFESSTKAKEWFGKEFVKHFVSTRDWEVREYERSVDNWQLRRYFEII